jgi:O-antigen/teichoic acid export membrane protein
VTLRSQVLVGLKWTVLGRISTQVVSWAITILVMRALLPADYGLVAMAAIFTGLFSIVAEIGLGSCLVQVKNVSEQQLRQVFGVVLLANVGVLLVLATLVAPLVALFFDEPRVRPVIQVLAIQFLPAAFAVIPGALLDRALEYRGRAFADFLSQIFGAALTLVLAYNGHGAWSLVWGPLLTSLLRAFALNVIMPFRHLPSFRLQGSGSMLRFGKDVAATQLVYFGFSQADSLIVGRMLGQHLLGIYSVSMNLASMPASRVASILNQVAFPAMSKVARDGGSVQQYILKSVRGVSFVAFPVMWGMSSVVPELVRGLLGERWVAAVPPMAIISLMMPLRMLGPIVHAALQSVGRADVSFRNTCITAIVMCGAFVVGCRFGLIGVAASWVIAFPCVFLFNLIRASPHLGLRVGQITAAMAKPAAASAVMCGAIWAGREMLSLAPLIMLGLLVGLGAAAYMLASLLFNREGLAELRRVIRPV